MSKRRHWGLHGHAINGRKGKLEALLADQPADAPCRSHIERIIDICEENLSPEGLRGDDLIEKWKLDVVDQWIRGLLVNHPELAEFGVRV